MDKLTYNRARISTVIGYQRFIARTIHCRLLEIVFDSYINDYIDIEINTSNIFATGYIDGNFIFLVGHYRHNGCARFEIKTRR